MYRVEQEEPSQEFKMAWNAAGMHIQAQAGSGLNWLRSDLNPPMAEHLSFRLGNQIFFIFVEAAECSFDHASSLFMRVSKRANAVPCLMKMRKRISTWEPDGLGWGLTHAISGELINPPDLISEELIEMSDWELHDFAIQVVCGHLEKEGKKVFSKQSALDIDPSIWFEDENGANFVIVREVRHPVKDAVIPDTTEAIKLDCSSMSNSGFFASVCVANVDDPFDPDAESNGNFLPLYRGHGMTVRFQGLTGL